MQKEKVVLVTGSARGIGAELIKGFARQGHRVVINYHKSVAAAQQLYEEMVAEVGVARVLKAKADVARRPAVQAMFAKAVAGFGRVDVLVNNAGINIDCAFTEMSDVQWGRVMATVLTGTFICSQEFVGHFCGEEGHIINIGATTGIVGRKNGANYCSAKAGVMALTKCLAAELAPRIRVNCVTPGWINTEEVTHRYDLENPAILERVINTIPLGRLGTPADVFSTIDFIVNTSAYITGQNFLVNGGYFMY